MRIRMLRIARGTEDNRTWNISESITQRVILYRLSKCTKIPSSSSSIKIVVVFSLLIRKSLKSYFSYI